MSRTSGTATDLRQRVGQRVVNGVAALGLAYVFLPIAVIVLAVVSAIAS